jgi:hypothetical protein
MRYVAALGLLSAAITRTGYAGQQFVVPRSFRGPPIMMSTTEYGRAGGLFDVHVVSIKTSRRFN